MSVKDVARHPIHTLDAWWDKASKERRLDHSPSNLFMIVGLMLSSLSIILQGPSPSSAVIGMPIELQVAMCGCIFGGLTIKFEGALSHTRFYRRDRPLKKCYQRGYTGAPLASSGLFVYGWYILSNTPNWLSALGSVLVAFLGAGVSAQAVLYWLEARRIERNERALIKAYVQQAVIDDEHDHDR